MAVPKWLSQCFRLLLLLCSFAPACGMTSLKLVKAPAVVCDGGPGATETAIWPVDIPRLGFARLGDGSCGDRSHATVAKIATPNKSTCESLCEKSFSCGAFDFCSGNSCTVKCRFFPTNMSYNETRPHPGVECFVKKDANTSKPHVITFLHSSKKSTSIGFTLTDSSPERKTIVANTNVTFEALASRRQLSAPFRQARGFGRGFSRGGHGFRSRAHVTRSSQSRSSFLAGGRTVSGKRAVGHFSNARNPRVGSYGYSQHQLGKNYPAGFRSTPYGLSGRSAYGVHSTVMVGSWLGSMFWLSRLSNMCHCLPGVMCCNRSRTDEGEDNVVFELEEDLRREDIMTTGFLPGEYVYPLRLTVTSVEGNDFDKSSICPPAGWDPDNHKNTAKPWTPPQHQELFFAVTQMEDLAPEQASLGTLQLVVFVLICLCAVGIPTASWCVSRLESKKTEANTEMRVSKRQVYTPMQKSTPMPMALGVQIQSARHLP